MKKIITYCLLLVATCVNGQHSVRLDLDRTISLATDSSYSAQKYQSV